MKKELSKDDAPAYSITELAHKIESLKGLEKQQFCKTLSEDQKKAYINYIRDRDEETVTGMFHFLELPGGSVTFNTMPYHGVVWSHTLVDKQKYTIPRGLARFLNEGCFVEVHKHIMDSNGIPIVDTSGKNYRFAFSSNY